MRGEFFQSVLCTFSLTSQILLRGTVQELGLDFCTGSVTFLLSNRMKARSVSVLGGESMDKDGKNGTFREMGKMFGINLQEKCGAGDTPVLLTIMCTEVVLMHLHSAFDLCCESSTHLMETCPVAWDFDLNSWLCADTARTCSFWDGTKFGRHCTKDYPRAWWTLAADMPAMTTRAVMESL